MNEIKLNEYLDDYARSHSPEAGRELLGTIMAIPREVDQQSKASWKISDWFLFLVPRLSGLTAACVLGLYMGSASGSALAEDELAGFDDVIAPLEQLENGTVTALVDVEDFIFVEGLE